MLCVRLNSCAEYGICVYLSAILMPHEIFNFASGRGLISKLTHRNGFGVSFDYIGM